MSILPIPSTPAEFRDEYPEHAQTAALLQELRDSRLSASRWSRSHLQALRVLRVPCPADGHLPVLQPYFRSASEQLRAAENGSLLLQLKKITKLDLGRCSNNELRRQCPQLGSYYANLANVLEPNPPFASLQSALELPLPRSRQTPLRSGFVTGEGLGFSSPTTASDGIHSSPSFAPSDNAPINRSEYEDRVKSEEVSRALASEFLGVICDLARDPLDRYQNRLEFTAESHTYDIPPLDTTCDDDGSFVLKGFHSGVWRREDLNAYCCLEAKRRYNQWEEDDLDDIGLTTNEEFAQQVGEMLGMVYRRMEYSLVLRNDSRQLVGSSECCELTTDSFSFFLISAHQNVHRFLYTHISDEYLSYLENPASSLVDDCFLEVWESREYDHCKPDDRINEATELKAMIDFLESSLA